MNQEDVSDQLTTSTKSTASMESSFYKKSISYQLPDLKKEFYRIYFEGVDHYKTFSQIVKLFFLIMEKTKDSKQKNEFINQYLQVYRKNNLSFKKKQKLQKNSDLSYESVGNQQQADSAVRLFPDFKLKNPVPLPHRLFDHIKETICSIIEAVNDGDQIMLQQELFELQESLTYLNDEQIERGVETKKQTQTMLDKTIFSELNKFLKSNREKRGQKYQTANELYFESQYKKQLKKQVKNEMLALLSYLNNKRYKDIILKQIPYEPQSPRIVSGQFITIFNSSENNIQTDLKKKDKSILQQRRKNMYALYYLK